MTAIEAYESLGFDTKTLGKDCAQSAAKRARQKARNGELNQKQITLMEVFQLKKCLK